MIEYHHLAYFLKSFDHVINIFTAGIRLFRQMNAKID